MAGPRVRFPRNIFWKLVVESTCKQVNLRSTKDVNNLKKYARFKLPLNSLIKLSGAFVCLNIEDTRQMACSQPNLILHTAHPNTFGKFVAQGGLSAPHCIEVADSRRVVTFYAHVSLSIKTEKISNQNTLLIIQVH